MEINFINFKIGYRQIPGRCEHTKDLLCNAETTLGGVRKKLGDLFWGFRANGTENQSGSLDVGHRLEPISHRPYPRFWEIQDPRFLEISFINFKIGYAQIPGRCEHTKDSLCNAETTLGGVRKKLGDLF